MTTRRRALTVLTGAAGIVFASLAIVGAMTALGNRADATHRFGDIGDGTFFHESTGWLADNGIADGFADGTFRPSDSITRGQASYWFSNFNDSMGLSHANIGRSSQLAHTHTAVCSRGRAVAGGGFAFVDELFMTDSEPVDTAFGPGTGWQVRWQFADGVSRAASLEVWALCLPGIVP